ncbi:hypothetical protein RHSIM_Rhsim02G0218900 [Rhododendron simsii]|uniref:Peptidase A1 domain-containing protein n=1 Tax=Rhododendron simsii TaxID=118357 RepID=A0A834HB20_RHOSS|nr:hypothetical protein RHSIM_Rhsim02G0218900 [Rhododendron simsii]
MVSLCKMSNLGSNKVKQPRPLLLCCRAARPQPRPLIRCLPNRFEIRKILILLSSNTDGHRKPNFRKRGNDFQEYQIHSVAGQSKAPSFYFVDLIGIKVGGHRLPVSESVFKTPGTIIDTGTVITRLPSAAYAALRTSFLESTKGSGFRNGDFSFLDTCYDYNMFDAVKIPTISFLFGGNIEVPVSEVGILYFHNLAKVCLAFARNTDASDVSILGSLHQETLDVVYDIEGEQIGFGTGGCS